MHKILVLIFFYMFACGVSMAQSDSVSSRLRNLLTPDLPSFAEFTASGLRGAISTEPRNARIPDVACANAYQNQTAFIITVTGIAGGTSDNFVILYVKMSPNDAAWTGIGSPNSGGTTTTSVPPGGLYCPVANAGGLFYVTIPAANVPENSYLARYQANYSDRMVGSLSQCQTVNRGDAGDETICRVRIVYSRTYGDGRPTMYFLNDDYGAYEVLQNTDGVIWV